MLITARRARGWAFLFNGLSFVAPLTGLLLMRTRELHQIERAPRGKGQLREGLRYVAGTPELIWPIVLVGFIGTFGFNFPIWLSAYADDVFHAGAGTYGLFNTPDGRRLAGRRAARRPPHAAPGCACWSRPPLLFGVLEVVASARPVRSGCSRC